VDTSAGAMSDVEMDQRDSRRRKGRGFKDNRENEDFRGTFDTVDGPSFGPAKSVEGWIVMVTGVHEEAQEEDFHNEFGELGEIKNLHLNLDRRTGFVKGYALLEYEDKKEAESAIAAMDGKELLGKTVQVSWAFSSGPLKK